AGEEARRSDRGTGGEDSHAAPKIQDQAKRNLVVGALRPKIGSVRLRPGRSDPPEPGSKRLAAARRTSAKFLQRWHACCNSPEERLIRESDEAPCRTSSASGCAPSQRGSAMESRLPTQSAAASFR